MGASIAQNDPRPFRDQVYEILRNEILTGTLAPGIRLIEREIAERLGVSRVPVREALRMLESERLVVVHSHRATLVRELSTADIGDLFDVREALEVLEARLAARKADAAGLETAERILAEARSALAKGDKALMDDANVRFHAHIAVLAENQALAAALEPISARLRWLYTQNLEADRVLGEHAEILAAIADGSTRRAGEVALRHIRESRRMVMEALREKAG